MGWGLKSSGEVGVAFRWEERDLNMLMGIIAVSEEVAMKSGLA